MSWLALGGAALLLALNAFFVTVEFSLIAARRTYLERLEREGNRRAIWAMRSTRELSVMLAGAQLGVTLASVGLGFVAEPAAARVLEPLFAIAGASDTTARVASFAVGLALVVLAHMVVGEMLPKNVAIASPERTALVIAGPLRLYGALLGPVIRVLNGSANKVLRLLDVEPADELAGGVTSDDLAVMIGESRDEGLLGDLERDRLRGALYFRDEAAASVMVPRREIVAAPSSSTLDDLERLVVETGRTRIPLYEGDLDHPTGFFHAKAVLEERAARNQPLSPRLVRPLLLVPATRQLHAVLSGMRQQRTHLALVTADDGSTLGLLTLQDVIERLLGQLDEEHGAP